MLWHKTIHSFSDFAVIYNCTHMISSPELEAHLSYSDRKVSRKFKY